MSPLLPLFLLGGTVLMLTSKGSARAADDVAPPAGPPPAPPPPSTTDGKCLLPEQTDLSNLPDDPFWNAYRYALLMDSDPKSLREFAASCEALCQPTAAKAIADKAAALTKAGVPDGYSPSGATPSAGTFAVPGLPVPIAIPTGYDPTGAWTLPGGGEISDSYPFPIPGVEDSPEPKFPVPVTAPGVPTAEQAPTMEPKPGKPGVRTWATTQWWDSGLDAGESPWSLAKRITGDGRRYPELMPANPEKATVGVPGSPSYTFVSFKIGERIRIPKGWNVYIDQTGKTTKTGYIWRRDPDEPA